MTRKSCLQNEQRLVAIMTILRRAVFCPLRTAAEPPWHPSPSHQSPAELSPNRNAPSCKRSDMGSPAPPPPQLEVASGPSRRPYQASQLFGGSDGEPSDLQIFRDAFATDYKLLSASA